MWFPIAALFVALCALIGCVINIRSMRKSQKRIDDAHRRIKAAQEEMAASIARIRAIEEARRLRSMRQ